MKITLSAFIDEASPNIYKQIEVLKKNNINNIELRSIDGKNILDFSIEEAKMYYKIYKENGINVYSLGSPIGKVDIDCDFNEYKTKFLHLLEIAKIFNTSRIRIFSFFKAYDKKETVFTYLNELVNLAKKENIELFHENEKDIYGDVLSRVEEIINNVKGIKIIYDPANFIQVGEESSLTIDSLINKVDYLHIKDVKKDTGEIVPAGEGDGNLERIINLLDRDIVFSLEPHLKIFEGYNNIDNSELKNKYVFSSNEEAFDVASNHLKNLLCKCGFKEKEGYFEKENSSKRIKYGIIGLGNQGTNYALNLFEKGLIKNSDLVAMCDIDQAKIDLMKSKTHLNVRYFLDYKKLIDSKLCDAILIETPHYIHPEIAKYALTHNVNVILDKPAGVYTKQVRILNEIAAKSDAKFTMMFNQRTNCVYRKMKEMITNGDIGKFVRVTWIITDWFRTKHYYDTGKWRATYRGEGGGVLINQCPHQLDLIQWILDKTPSFVTSFVQFGIYHDIEVEDEVTAFLEYDNHATGVFITTTGEAPGTNRLEISGTKGKLICENDKLIFYKNLVDSQEFLLNSNESFAKPEVEILEIETDNKNEQHKGIINNFTSYLLNEEPLFVDGKEGIKGVELMNAIELSGWLNSKRISLPVDEELYIKELRKHCKNSKNKDLKMPRFE